MSTNKFPLGAAISALIPMLVVWWLLVYPNFLKPLAAKLEARTRADNQAIMIIYAEELYDHLQKTHQPLTQIGLLWLNSLLEKKVSPYPVAFGPVRVISCDDQGCPLNTSITHLCSQIGYYTDGQVYKLVVWGGDFSLTFFPFFSINIASIISRGGAPPPHFTRAGSSSRKCGTTKIGDYFIELETVV